MSFGGDIKPWVPGNPLKLAQVLLGVSLLAGSFPVNQYIYIYIYIYMWQSRVEIEHYSVAYFDRIAAFEAP